MSAPSKSLPKVFVKQISKHDGPTSSPQKEGANAGATAGQNIYVFTPSKLKELGFVTKVKDGQTVLVPTNESSKHNTASIMKQVFNSEDEKGTSLLARSSEVTIAIKSSTTSDTSSTTSIVESPGRRRIIQGFSRFWSESLKLEGFIKCPLRHCTFISLRHEDMCTHYISCNGLANNTTFLCPICKCCLKTRDDLQLHIERTHTEHPSELRWTVESPRSNPKKVPPTPLSNEQLIVRKRGYNKVHKQAWTISVEEKGYVKCIFQNCIFMALSVVEMIEHYRSCNSKGLDKLFVCPYCKGGVRTQEKLRTHIGISHSTESDTGSMDYKAVSLEETPKQQDSDKAGALTDPKRVMPPERWNSFQDILVSKPSTDEIQSKNLPSPRKNLSKGRKPCYAPDVDQVQPSKRVSSYRIDARVNRPLSAPDTPSVPIPCSQISRVCTFFKRHPNQGAVELFPTKVCTFVKTARLSSSSDNKRRLSATDWDRDQNQHSANKQCRTREQSPAFGGESLVIDLEPHSSPAYQDEGNGNSFNCKREVDDSNIAEVASATCGGVDYYISESSREVVYQEEITEESEYVISDIVEETEVATENAPIKYFENFSYESQKNFEKKVEYKLATSSTILTSDSANCVHKIVSADMIKAEPNISPPDGNDCSRSNENTSLEQLPLQIADNFVSDPLTSDLVVGLHSTKRDVLITHTAIVEKPLFLEPLPFPVTQAEALTENKEHSHEELCTEDFVEAMDVEQNPQDSDVFTQESENFSTYNEAGDSVETSRDLGMKSCTVDDERDVESKLVVSVVESTEGNEPFVENEDNFNQAKTQEFAAGERDISPGSHLDGVHDVVNYLGTASEVTSVVPAMINTANDALRSWSDEPYVPQELGQSNKGLRIGQRKVSQLITPKPSLEKQVRGRLSKKSLKRLNVGAASEGKEFAQTRAVFVTDTNCIEQEEDSVLKPPSHCVANDYASGNEPFDATDLPSMESDLLNSAEPSRYISKNTMTESDSTVPSAFEEVDVELPAKKEEHIENEEVPIMKSVIDEQLDSTTDIVEPKTNIIEDNPSAETAVTSLGDEDSTNILAQAEIPLEIEQPPVISVMNRQLNSATDVLVSVSGEVFVKPGTENVKLATEAFCLPSKPTENVSCLLRFIEAVEKEESQVEVENTDLSEVFDENLAVPQCSSKADGIDFAPEKSSTPADSRVVGTSLKVSHCGILGESNALGSASKKFGRLRKVKMVKFSCPSREPMPVNEMCDLKSSDTVENIPTIPTDIEMELANGQGQSQNETVMENTSVFTSKHSEVWDDNSAAAHFPASVISDEHVQESVDSAFVEPLKQQEQHKKEVISTDNSPTTCEENETMDVVVACESVISQSSQASVSVAPVKKRGRPRKEEISNDNSMETSQIIETVQDGFSAEKFDELSETGQVSALLKPVKKRGRPKKEVLLPKENSISTNPIETVEGSRPAAKLDSVQVIGIDESVQANVSIEPDKKRGRRKKEVNAGETETSTISVMKPPEDDIVPAHDESVVVSPPVEPVKKRGRPKKRVLNKPVEIAKLSSSTEKASSVSEILKTSLEVKPVLKRGRRSKKEFAEANNVAESLESATNKLVNKTERPLGVDVGLNNETMVTKTLETEGMGPISVQSQPVNKRGKNNLSDEIPQETAVPDINQEHDPGEDHNLVPNEISNETSNETVAQPNKKTSKKRGRWPKKALSADQASSHESPVISSGKVSRGRGKKSATALIYEEMERKRGQVSPLEIVKCGKCGVELMRKQFLPHNKSKHCGLGWIVGELTVDMGNLDQVRFCLQKMYGKKGRKEITCEVCKTSKRSIEGFMAHIELFCQKSTEEQEAMKVNCPICDRLMLPTSLKVHMGVSHKSGLVEEEVPEIPRELGKRAAAARAVSRLIACMKEDEIESKNGDMQPENSEQAKQIQDKELMELYKRKGGPRKINSLLNTRLRKELETSGIMTCKNIGCTYVTPEFELMQTHFVTCEKIPDLTFCCKRCVFTCSDEDVIRDHVANAPRHKNDKANAGEEAADSDFPDDVSGGSDPEDVDATRQQGLPRRSALFNLNKNSRLLSRVKFLSNEISKRVPGDEMYLPTSKWWLSFQNDNFRDELYPTIQSDASDWEQLDATSAEGYLPLERESIPLAAIRLDTVAPVPQIGPNLEWKRLKLFETGMMGDAPVMFVGGPIWAMAWCPIPNELLLDAENNVSQFLAVSCHRGMDDVYSFASGRTGNGLIQIWDFGSMDHSKPCGVPRLALGIAHEYGAVWHIEWCPSGCYDRRPHSSTLRRMGLLAAACSDGRIHIFAVPFPSELTSNTDSPGPVIFKTVALITLLSGMYQSPQQQDRWMCTRLSWYKNKEHQFIAGGFTNGMVSMWDIKSTSPLLTRNEGKKRLIFAFKTFQAHMGTVTALSLFPYFDGRYLMTGGIDRYTKIWDLEQTNSPISASFKGIVTDGIWLSHWVTTITAYDDGFGIHHGNSTLHSVRNFGFNPFPLLPQNSPVWSVSGSEWSNAVAQGTAAGELCIIFPHQLFLGVDVEKGMKNKRMVISYIHMLETDSPTNKADETPVPSSNLGTIALEAGCVKSQENTSMETELTVGQASTETTAGGDDTSDIMTLENQSVASSCKLSTEDVCDESKYVSDDSGASSDGSLSSDEIDDECDDGNESGNDNLSVISVENKKYDEKEFLPRKYDQILNRFKLALCSYPVDNFKKIPNKARETSRTSEQMRATPTEMYPITSINRVSWNPNCTSHLWLASGYHCGLVRVPCIRGMQNAAFAQELFSKAPDKTLADDQRI